MKMVKTVMFAILGAISLIANFSVVSQAYSEYLVDEPISYDQSFVLDITANNLTYASATANYDDGTPAAKTFTDGSISTGNITITTLTGLTTAYASDTITVLSTSNISGASIALPGFVFKEKVDWRVGATTSATAVSLSTALAKIPWLTVTVNAAVITITAKVPGTFYNSIPVSSKNANITVATALMAGGADNVVVKINGIEFIQAKDWFVGATTTTAATNLAAAINAHATLSTLMTATAGSGPTAGIIQLVSDASGLAKNFSLNSSVPAALVMSGTAMTGGLDAAFSVGAASINIPAHGFNTALPVLYTEDTNAVDPLVDQTTYYAIPVDVNTIKLATTSARAVLGLGVSITTTGTTGHTYTLTPTPITGSGNSSFKWQVSSNNVNWSDMAVDSVTIADYGTLPLSTSWDLDTSKRYIRFSVVAPTAGALDMSVLVAGLPLSEFARTTGDTFTGRVNFVSAPIVMTGAAGTITSASTVTALSAAITGTGAAALDVAGGINAGSGNVGIVDTTGKIPALSTTYLANMAGTNLTGLVKTAGDTMTGTLASSGKLSFNYVEATDAADGTVYNMFVTSANVGPSSAASDGITNLLSRYRWYTGDNSNAIINGIEGVCSSYGADESITCRGASLRSYINPGATIRTSIGADLSARASYSGGTDIVADPGTAFVGARIWMAPYFTALSTANINNFHGLWIYNEHTTVPVTNGIFLSDAGGGYTYDLSLQSGETIDNATNGKVKITADVAEVTGQFTTGAVTSAALALLVPNSALSSYITNSDTGNLCKSSATVVGSWVIVSTPTSSCY